MPHFVIHCTDKPGSAAVRAENRPQHLEYLGGLGDALFLAGPLMDAEGASIGSIIIVECADQTAANALAANDPFAKAGLFSAVAVMPWRKTFPA